MRDHDHRVVLIVHGHLLVCSVNVTVCGFGKFVAVVPHGREAWVTDVGCIRDFAQCVLSLVVLPFVVVAWVRH